MVLYLCPQALMRWGGGGQKKYLTSSGKGYNKYLRNKMLRSPQAPPNHYEQSLTFLRMYKAQKQKESVITMKSLENTVLHNQGINIYAMKEKCTDLLQRLRVRNGHQFLQKISWGIILVTIGVFGMSKRSGQINNTTPKKENQATQIKTQFANNIGWTNCYK